MINSLPSSLRNYTNRIEAAISTWPITVSMDHAVRWVLQFDSEDYSLAVRIIENLDILGSSQVRTSLEVAHTKLLRRMGEKGSPLKGNNTLFAAIGSSAKSGALIAYHYRVSAEIPEDDFVSNEEEEQLNLSKIENIVLVDDVIGTGKTIAKEVTRLAEQVYSLSQSRNIFILTVAGYEDGVQHVIEETGASVVCALEYSSIDTVSNMDAAFYGGLTMAERNADLQRIKRYCRSISRSELGFGAVGGLLVFDHNTPNTTLPIIWYNGKGWLPLFPRSTRIPGASKVLKSAEKERADQAAKTNQQKTPEIKRETAELTLFIEGKVDEIFVDLMRQKRNLAKKIGVGDVTAVALGGMHHSSRLLELLQKTKKYAVFVLEDDKFTRRISEKLKEVDKVEVLDLKPSFVAMLDIQKIYADKDQFPGLPDAPDSPPNERWFHDVEMALFKRGPTSSNTERIMQLIDDYLAADKYEEFITDLRKITEKIFTSTAPQE